MRDELIYHEFANWKIEHHDLLKYLMEADSGLMIHFKHVLEVIDYLYDKLIDDMTYTDEEDQIFETGFLYVLEQVDKLNEVLNKSYQNNLEDLEKHAKDLNLLLATVDFQNELLGMENFDQKDLDKLISFEKYVNDMLNRKKEIPLDKFSEFDHLTDEIFSKFDYDFYTVNQIFLEIADELGIL
ncbi:MAG: hypothetical protein EP317_01750 [Bacillota bacterium]|nr:MAG: hypothetical protein EP317_01750 [Bacillota bacterium]